MKKFTKIVMGLLLMLLAIYMIYKHYNFVDMAAAFIGLAMSIEFIVDILDYILDKASKGE